MLSKLLITFFCCVILQQSSISSSSRTTILSQSESSEPLLSFVNSSSQIVKVTPLVTKESHLIHVGENSLLHFSEGTIIGSRSTIPFSVDGRLLISDVLVTFQDRDTVFPIVLSESLQNSGSSSITVVSSTIESVPILSGSKATLISLGNYRSQEVRDCVFDNVTCVGVESESGVSSKAWNCVVQNTLMTRCEEALYGGIVTGLTDMTAHLFECVNSSFIGCFRERNPSPNADVECSSETTVNCSYGSSAASKTGIALSGDKEYRFVDCTFLNTSSTNRHGGALYMTGSSSNYGKALRVLRCSFTTSEGKATKNGDVRGGAVGAFYLATVYVTACNFTDCHTPYQKLSYDSLYHGGALITMYISALCSVSSCTFTNCHCGTQGGGFYPVILNYTCPEGFAMCSGCSFFGCSANGSHPGGSMSTSSVGGNNGYGGGAFYWPESVQHVRECLYVSCYAQLFGGGLRWDFETSAEAAQSTGKFLFFRNNDATRNSSSTPGGHDVSLDGTTQSVFDSFSFTFDNRTHRVNLNGNGNSTGSSKDSWLPYPVIKYLNASVSATDESGDCLDINNTKCATLRHAYDDMTFTSTKANLVIFLLNTTHSADETGLAIDGYSTMISTYDWNGAYSVLQIGENFTDSTLFDVSGGALTLLKLTVAVEKNWGEENMVSVSGGNLVFMDVTFSSATDSVVFDSAPISVSEEGSLSFSRTVLHTFNMSNAPLISYTSLGSSSFSMCDIYNITRQEGNGGVFELNGDEPTSFTLTGVTMTNCACQGGSGGAVYANCLESSVLKFDVLVFDNCTASDYGGALHIVMAEGCSLSVIDTTFRKCEAQRGGGCYVDVNGQPTTLHFESTSFSENKATGEKEYTEDDGYGSTLFIVSERREYLGTDTSDFDSFVDESSAAAANVKIEDPEKYTVKLAHIFEKPDKFYVKSKSGEAPGNDLRWCDDATRPCATLDGAMKVATELNGVHNLTTFTIEQMGNTDDHDAETATVQVDAGYTVTFKPSTNEVVSRVIAQPTQAAFEVNHSDAVVTITNIKFLLGLPSFTSSLFVVDAGSITLTTITVEPKEAGSTVNAAAPLIQLGTGVVATITSLSVSNINGTALHGDISASLTMDKCAFAQCGSLDDYPSVSLTASESAVVTLTDSNFTECQSDNYGALSVTVSDTATLTLTGCNFTTCKTGTNGAVLSVSHSGSNTFTATGCKITSPTGTGAALRVQISGTGSVTYSTCDITNDASVESPTCCALSAEVSGSGELTFSNCPFSHWSNGAIDADVTESGALNFSNCQFTDCKHSTWGAASLNTTGSGAIGFYTCTFDSCASEVSEETTTPATSVSLVTSGSSPITLSGCTFTASGSLNMESQSDSNGSITISSCSFTLSKTTQANDESAPVNGGGVYISNALGDGAITITECNFTDCATHGAICVKLSDSRSLTITKCQAVTCSSTPTPSYAMCVEGAESCSVIIEECNVTNCSPISLKSSGYISIAKLISTNEETSTNEAITAELSESGSLNLTDSTFTRCSPVLKLTNAATGSVEISLLTVSGSTGTVFDITASGAGSLTIKDSNFTACTATDAPAVLKLALESTSTGSLTVSNCTATGCTPSTDVMSVTASGTGAITISDCTFEPSTTGTTTDGGAISLTSTAGSDIEISGCAFTGCTKTTETSDDSSKLNGGAIYLSTTGTGTVTLTGCTFNSSTCKGYGGGVYIYAGEDVSSEKLTFNDLTFDPSCADKQGTKTPKTGDPVSYGNGIFIDAPEQNFSFFTSYTKWADLVPVADKYKEELDFVYTGRYKTTPLLLQHLIYKPSEGNKSDVYADPTVEDDITVTVNNEPKMTCGWEDLPCLRIQSAWENAYKYATVQPTNDDAPEVTNDVTNIYLKGETEHRDFKNETSEIAVANYKVTIGSEDLGAKLEIGSSFNSPVLLSVGDGSLSVDKMSIYVNYSLQHVLKVNGAGSIELKNLDITLEQELSASVLSLESGTGTLNLTAVGSYIEEVDAVSQSSVISLGSNGQLTCNDLQISHFILTGSDPLITMTSPSQGTFEHTKFSNIIRSSGNGAVFNFDLTPRESDAIEFTGMTFTSCDCSTGYGGAIYLSLKQKPASLKLDVSFETCSAGMGLGSNLYINASFDVIEANLITTAAFSNVQFGDESTLYWVNEQDADSTWDRVPFSASLIHFLFPPMPVGGSAVKIVYISNTAVKYGDTVTQRAGGVDSDTCGWEDIPCLTLAKAITNSGAPRLLMSAGTHKPEDSSLSFTSLTTIVGSDVIKQVMDLTAEQTHYVIAAAVQFDTITFSLPTELKSSLIEAGSGKLTLSSVTFGMPDTTVTLSKSLIVTSTTTVIESCSFNNIILSSEVEKGAVLHSTISDTNTLTLQMRSGTTTKNTLTSCHGSVDNTGAIYIYAPALTEPNVADLTVQSTVFNNDSPTRSGEYIFINADKPTPKDSATQEEINSLFVRSKWKDTINKRDNDIKEYFMVYDPTLDTQSKYKSVVDYLFPTGNVRYVSATEDGGADDSNCGPKTENVKDPCATIYQALQNSEKKATTFYLAASGTNTIKPETHQIEFNLPAPYTICPDPELKEDNVPLRPVSKACNLEPPATFESGKTSLFLVNNPQAVVDFTLVTFKISKDCLCVIEVAQGVATLTSVTIHPDAACDIQYPLIIVKADGSLTVDKCHFSNVNYAGSAYHAAAIDAVLSKDHELVITGTTTENTEFDTCTTTDTNAKSGAVYVCTSVTDASVTIQVQHTTFSGCTYTSTSKNMNVYIECFDATTLITDPSYWAGSGYDGDAADYFKVTESQTPSGSTRSHTALSAVSVLHFLKAPSDKPELYCKPDGVDLSTCGWEDLQCASLPRTLKQSDATVTDLKVYLAVATHTAETSMIALTGKVKFTISAPSIAPSIKKVEAIGNLDSALFFIECPVEFTRIDFVILSSMNKMNKPLFYGKADTGKTPKLTLSHVCVKPETGTITVNATSLLMMDGGVVNITGCTFEGISITSGGKGFVDISSSSSVTISGTTQFKTLTHSGSEGTASILRLSLPADASLDISDCTFDTCRVTSPNAKTGAIYTKLDATPSQFNIQRSVRFSTCTYGTSYLPRYIYFTCVNGITLFSQTEDIFTFGNLGEYKKGEEEYYWVVESDRDVSGVPLNHFLFPPPDDATTTAVYVGPALRNALNRADEHAFSADTDNCGWDDIPCLTISNAMTISKATGEPTTRTPTNLKIVLLSGGDLTEETAGTAFTTGTIELKPDSSAVLTKPVNGGSFTCNGASVTVSSIIFSVESLSASLFDVQDGTLTLTGVTVTPKSSSITDGHMVVNIAKGTTTIQNSIFGSFTGEVCISFTGEVCISAEVKESCTLTVENTSFTGCAGAIAVTVSSGGTFTSTGNTFTDCTSATGNAGAISVKDYQSANELTISGNTFKTCKGTLGGAVSAKMTSGKLTVTNNKYDGCQRTSEAGRALYVSMTNGQFNSSGNKFSNGGGIYGEFSSTNTWDMSNDAFENCQSESVYLDMKSTGAVTVSECVFTYPDAARGRAITAKQQENKLTITKSNFTNCVQAVVSDTQAGTFEISDSRFESSTSSAVSATVTSGTCTVSNSYFSKCTTSEDGGALYVKVTTDGQVSVSATTFDQCSSTKTGGAIYTEYSSAKELTINGNTFTTCTGASGGAIYAKMTSTGKLNVTNNEYNECKSTSTDGGALYLTMTDSVNGQFTSSGNTFTGCESEGLGGAIYAEYPSTQEMTVTGNTFKTCKCKGQFGGAVYAKITTSSTGTLTVTNNKYDGCQSTPETGGALYVNMTGGRFTSSGNKFSNGGGIYGEFSSDKKDNTWSISNDAFTECPSESVYLDMKSNGSVTVSACVFNQCGRAIYATQGAKNTLSIKESNFTTCTGAIMTSTKTGTLEISDSRFEDCESATRSGGLNVEVTSGQLNITNSVFTNCNSTLESGNGGAVEVSLGSGKVYVVGTTFTGCESKKNGGALDVSITSSGQLSVSSSNFTGCTGANGGGVYAAFTKSSSKLIFESVCFDTCSVTGYGGGMYLSCGNYLSTRSVSFSSVTGFTSSSEMTNTGTGVFINVTGSLSNFTKYDGWSNLITLSEYVKEYDPVYTGECGGKKFPLQHLLFGPPNPPLYVDPTGTDAWSCGWEDLPCSVICTAQQRGSQVATIQLAEGDHEAEYLTSEFTGSTIEYTVGPKEGADKVPTKLISSLSEAASGIFVVLAKSVTFNKIQFNIDPSSFVEYTPFYVSSGKLILESVSVSSSDDSSASLMAPLIKVKVDSQRASARANQQTEEGDATQEEEAAVSAYLKSSNFTNLIMSTSFQTASTIVVENGTSSSIEIDGCEFTNCSSQASLAGGALYYMMTTDSKLVLKDIKTTTCQCNLETGRGGFMFLTVPDTDKTLITITNPTFTNNNAKVGRDMFVVFPPLTDEGTQSRIQEVLDFKFEDLGDTLYDVENSAYGRPEYPAITAFEDIDLLPLLYHYEADTVVINTAGKDNLWCGAAEKACLTLVYGCKHFNESEAKTLAFGDGSSLGGELSMNGFGVKPYVAPAARMMNADDTASIPVTVDDAIVVVSTASNTIPNTINSTVFTFDDSFFGSKDVFITVETDAALTMTATSFTGYDIASTSKQVVTVLGTLTLTTCAFTGPATPAMTVEGTVTLSGCVFNGAAASSTAQTSSETTTSSETPTSTEAASSTTAVSDEQPKEEQPSTEENAASSGETQSTETGGTGETGLRALSNADVTTNELCAWTGGYLKLIGSSAVGTLTGDTTFTNCSVGAVLLQGGATLTVDKAQFNQNSASLTEYDHVRRNIRCESSTVNVNSMTVDGSKPGSLWISTSNCTLDEATISSLRNKATPLFVPNITNVTATASSNQVVVSFSGDLIVPCNLYVYTSLSTWENVPLTGTPGETSAVFVFPSSFVKSFTIATAVYCQVEYKNDADNWNVTDQFILKQPVIERRSRGGINNSGVPWYIIPLIIVPFILFLIFLFCYLRKLLTREAYNPDEADSINKQIESSAAADQTEIPIAPAPISDEEFNAAADDDDDDAGEVDVAAAKAGSNLPSTVEGISTAPTHERVTLSTEASLFSRIHDPAEREQFYPAQWAADIGLKVASTCQYMIDILYPDRSTQPPPQQGPQLTHEQMKQILRNLSSHSMFYSDDGVLGLSTIPGTTQVPVSRDLLHGTAAFSQERLRFVSPELMHAPPADTRESVSAGVVYAVAMLLLEVATGWGVFDGSPAEKAAQLVMDGARPDLSAVALLNVNLAQVIAMGYSQAPQSRPSLQQMQAILKPLAPVRPDEEDLGDEDESKEEDSDADGDSSDDSDDVPPPPPRQPAPPAKKSTEMQPPPVPPKKAAAQTKASPFGAKPTTKQPPAPQSKSQSTLQPPRFQPRPPAKQQTASTRPLPGFRPSSSQ